MSWIKLVDAPAKYGLDYQGLRRLAMNGKLKHERRGMAWWLWEPDVELLAAKETALRDGIATPAELDALDAASASVRDTVKQICTALISAEVGYRSLAADRAQAIERGDLPVADMIAETVAHLKAARVAWNGQSWTLTVPGIGSATTQPAPAKVEA